MCVCVGGRRAPQTRSFFLSAEPNPVSLPGLRRSTTTRKLPMNANAQAPLAVDSQFSDCVIDGSASCGCSRGRLSL